MLLNKEFKYEKFKVCLWGDHLILLKVMKENIRNNVTEDIKITCIRKWLSWRSNFFARKTVHRCARLKLYETNDYQQVSFK